MKANVTLFKKILIFINFIVLLCYLVTCLLPFINTGENWILALPGLIFPFIFFLLIVNIILLFFFNSKWYWISIIILLLGFQQIAAVFAFNFPQKFHYDKKPNTLRVLQWNVTSWDEGGEYGESNFRIAMLNLVNEQNADILCFQEFFESKDTVRYKSNIARIVNMGFPYYYFVPNKLGEIVHSGIAIFSKYPIIDSANFSFERNYTGDHLLLTDIKVHNKIFRIFTTHLQPLYFNESDYHISNWIEIKEASNIFSKLKKGYEYRYIQADLIEEKINDSPYPVIICGDFNDLPNSSVYFKIRGKLQDTFLKKGSGFGRTTQFISPTLRIDYILADKYFTVNQFQILKVSYSGNHYPVETDLEYQEINH